MAIAVIALVVLAAAAGTAFLLSRKQSLSECLVGTWRYEATETLVDGAWQREPFSEDLILIVAADGSLVVSDPAQVDRETFNYVISGNVITATRVPGDDVDTATLTCDGDSLTMGEPGNTDSRVILRRIG